MIDSPAPYTAVAIEWSGLESPESNMSILLEPTAVVALDEIPDDFSWTYQEIADGFRYTRHLHDEGVFDRIIAREFPSGHRWIREDLNHDGQVIRRSEYDLPPEAGATLLSRFYYRYDGPFGSEQWVFSEEHFDPADGWKTEYVRYYSPQRGHTEYEHWWYEDGRPLKRYHYGYLVFDYTWLLETTVSPETGGTIQRSPNNAGFRDGRNVALTAVADPGYSFSHWQGDLSGSTPARTIAMTSHKDVTAVFTPNTYYVLSTDVAPGGVGGILRDPDLAAYLPGQEVTLTAVGGEGYQFGHWQGALSGTHNPAAVTMSADQSVTAVFVSDAGDVDLYRLDVSASPQAGGQVFWAPQQDIQRTDQPVTIVALPEEGYRFAGWSGDADGTENPMEFVPPGNLHSYREDFDHESGWQVVNGRWAIEDGQYVQTETGWSRQKAFSDFAVTDGSITFAVTPLARAGDESFPWTCFGVYPKYMDPENFIYVRFGAYGGITVEIQEGGVGSSANPGRTVNHGPFDATVGREYEVEVTVDGGQMRLYVDGTSYGTVTIPFSGMPGWVGFYTENPTAYDYLQVITDDLQVVANFVEDAGACNGADVTGDGMVDDNDLSIVLANWTGPLGTGKTHETGDIDGSGGVSDADLSILLANWGCPEAVAVGQDLLPALDVEAMALNAGATTGDSDTMAGDAGADMFVPLTGASTFLGPVAVEEAGSDDDGVPGLPFSPLLRDARATDVAGADLDEPAVDLLAAAIRIPLGS